jgi:prevent-host-death family protein
MGKEKILSFVEARANLSEIVDQVSKRGQTYVIAKRDKPVAVIVGFEKYQEMANGRKHLKSRGGKRILKLSDTATGVANIDEAIKELRKSRIASVAGSF